MGHTDDERDMVKDILSELYRARAKFPGKNLTLIATGEEYGELCKAAMDEPRGRVYQEAVQLCVMAMRVWLDGDHSVEYRREEQGLHPLGDSTSRYWEQPRGEPEANRFKDEGVK